MNNYWKLYYGENIKHVKTIDDMYSLKIGDVFIYRGRKYLFDTWGRSTIATNYETFNVLACSNGKRSTLKFNK